MMPKTAPAETPLSGWLVIAMPPAISATTLTVAVPLTALETKSVAVIVCDGALCERFAGLGFRGVGVAVGDAPDGWLAYEDVAAGAIGFEPDGPTAAADPLLLYFTSGTTQLPKLVEHTHASYPAGHLSTIGPDGTPQVKPLAFTYNAALGTIDIAGYAMSCPSSLGSRFGNARWMSASSGYTRIDASATRIHGHGRST